MELREWLIILGLALVTLIVIDGVRRLQRQRRVPRLDQDATDHAAQEDDGSETDPEAAARAAEINWELPNGGARVVRSADVRGVQPKPKLQRQPHPGPSRVLAEFRSHTDTSAASVAPSTAAPAVDEVPPDHARAAGAANAAHEPSRAAHEPGLFHHAPAHETTSRREPGLSSLDDVKEPAVAASLAADPDDHDGHSEDAHHRLVDLEGMGESLKSGSRRVGSSMQRLSASLQKSLAERRAHQRHEQARRDQSRAEEPLPGAQRAAPRSEERVADTNTRDTPARQPGEPAMAHSLPATDGEPRAGAAQAAWREGASADATDAPVQDDVVRTHPVLERALRHDVSAEHARETLSQADEIIVISVIARDEEGFSGTALLDLMLTCGLRYSRDMGIFHRFETEDPESRLQFSMVNVVKPGTFPIEAMDDFRTPGITLLMPLPGAQDTAAAFEAMVETAMVIVRHLGGELKDEHRSVMTAQTVEFARQRVQEFERRNRLNRYQVN